MASASNCSCFKHTSSTTETDRVCNGPCPGFKAELRTQLEVLGTVKSRGELKRKSNCLWCNSG
jgi:hypothetical protein